VDEPPLKRAVRMPAHLHCLMSYKRSLLIQLEMVKQALPRRIHLPKRADAVSRRAPSLARV
jgi:hypothetical protein